MTAKEWIAIDGELTARHVCLLLAKEQSISNVLVVADEPKCWKRLFRPWAGELRVSFAANLPVYNDDRAPTLKPDAVVAIDECSRQPRESRVEFHRSLARASTKVVIQCGPLGTDIQTSIYRSLAAQYREKFGAVFSPLELPLKFGLPVPDDIFTWIGANEEADLFYSGDVAVMQQQAERLIQFARWQKIFSSVINRANPIANSDAHVFTNLETVPMRRHCRFYLYSYIK